jgi:signal transduction histidine kinase
MRELSNKLHSSILEHTGIAVALRAYCAELSARPGIRILFESDGEFDTVPLRIGRGLYRIAQESLTGVARGSVRISFADRQLEMAIESETALSISPLGLAILRQRANSIGAALRMESSRLTVSVPLKTPRPGAQTTE